MKIIYARKGEEILVDDEDYEALTQYDWYIDRFGYVARYQPNPDPKKSSLLFMHRQLMGLDVYEKRYVDHINRKRHDNRKENLRFCTYSQNQWNRGKSKTNTSGFKGVSWHIRKKKWTAMIRENYRQHYLGLFDTPEEAHEAYCKAAALLHGEFANGGEAPLDAQQELAVIAPLVKAALGE